MSALERSSSKLSRQLPTWWRFNRSWAVPTSVLAVLLPLVAVGSCLATVLTLAFGTARLSVSIRRHVRRNDDLDE
jgi:hypothetical protein